ncbi:MAG: YggS family pyridoxal phosphate-dependent enzyme [Hyphomicrobiaceae bacterium]
MTDPQQALTKVYDTIAAAAREDNRDASDVQLIAVSKTFDGEAIRPVLQAGHRAFGENRVQEAAGKWPGLRAEFSDIDLHLIGPLQSNKARQAVQLFDAIHTIDRPKIAQAIASEMQAQGKALKLFIQVNTGEEAQKAGVLPAESGEFVHHCRETLKLPIEGLMCIPPIDEEPGVHFALLGELARDCGLAKLSMGMSSDYEIAIAFGATHVRVGSAIFGAR